MATSGSYHHGALREALLDAASSMGEGSGLHGGLSLRGVARRAGVTHAAAYRHFDDKKALLRALALRGFAKLDGVMDGFDGDSAFQLGDVAVAYVSLAREMPTEFGLMFDRSLCLPAGEPDELAQAGLAAQARLAGLLATRFALPEQASFGLAMALLSQMHGVAILALETPALQALTSDQLEDLTRSAASFLATGPGTVDAFKGIKK